MSLSPPTVVTWLASSALAASAVAAKYFGIATLVPEIGPLVSGHLFETLLAAYVLLWLGTVFNRI